MKKKKLLSLFLVSLLSVSVLGGCASKKPSINEKPPVESTDNKKPEETDKEVSEDKEPVTITLHMRAADLTDDWKSDLEEFTDEYPWITTDVQVVEEGDGSELMAQIASGTAPSMTYMSYPMIEKYINAGVLEDLTPFIDNSPEKDGLNRNMLDMFKTNGKYYGVPYEQYAMVLFYNKELFAEADVTPPTTWDEWLTVSKALTDPAKQRYGLALNWSQWAEWWFQTFAWGAGGELTVRESDGTLVPTFTDPGVIKAAEFYRTLKSEKVIQPGATTGLDDLFDDFSMNRAAMIISGFNTGPFIDLGMDPDNLGIAPIPAGPSGKGPAQVGGNSYVIPANQKPEEVEAAWAYIEYLLREDVVVRDLERTIADNKISYFSNARNDVNIYDYIDVPEDVRATLEHIDKEGNTHPEFYGKAAIGSFVDAAVQEMMVHDTKDIEEIFAKHEADAMKKEIPDFNATLKDK